MCLNAKGSDGGEGAVGSVEFAGRLHCRHAHTERIGRYRAVGTFQYHFQHQLTVISRTTLLESVSSLGKSSRGKMSQGSYRVNAQYLQFACFFSMQFGSLLKTDGRNNSSDTWMQTSCHKDAATRWQARPAESIRSNSD